MIDPRQPNPHKPHVSKLPSGRWLVVYGNLEAQAFTCKGAIPMIGAEWKKATMTMPPWEKPR